jgi:hypothetical protein
VTLPEKATYSTSKKRKFRQTTIASQISYAEPFFTFSSCFFRGFIKCNRANSKKSAPPDSSKERVTAAFPCTTYTGHNDDATRLKLTAKPTKRQTKVDWDTRGWRVAGKGRSFPLFSPGQSAESCLANTALVVQTY